MPNSILFSVSGKVIPSWVEVFISTDLSFENKQLDKPLWYDISFEVFVCILSSQYVKGL